MNVNNNEKVNTVPIAQSIIKKNNSHDLDVLDMVYMDYVNMFSTRRPVQKSQPSLR